VRTQALPEDVGGAGSWTVSGIDIQWQTEFVNGLEILANGR